MPAAADISAEIFASGQASGVRGAHLERSPLMFDPWLTSSHRVVRAIADNILAGYASVAPPRRRRMKDRDRRSLEQIIRTIVANLAFAVAIKAEPAAVAVSLRTAKQRLTRYDRKGFAGLPVILETLSAAPNILLTLRKSHTKAIASQMLAQRDFVETLQRFRFEPQHFAPAVVPRESISLSKTERDYIDGTTTREPIDYADTAETRRYRAEMERINSFLTKADLRMEPDGDPMVITSTHRHLCRYFKLPPGEDRRRFDLGGRLFGGWWEGLSRERRHAIRINGEPIADLDLPACFCGSHTSKREPRRPMVISMQ